MDQFSQAVSILDNEKEGEVATAGKRIHELEVKIANL